ncbi:hypothetical protein LYNGBM3L_53300 [Moorena producens 3L]|uniref:Uncharacterized protein n=1 Tax=Moorena producens 3L TaxID=489825 RepID=F4XYQ5_9CYAN|nr:hypothetical protein LYNGBM3L_53300 [Moorena producens 3L]OLT67717.1 hypothetical protein BI334_24175 [Moorena producens 3L]
MVTFNFLTDYLRGRQEAIGMLAIGMLAIGMLAIGKGKSCVGCVRDGLAFIFSSNARVGTARPVTHHRVYILILLLMHP